MESQGVVARDEAENGVARLVGRKIERWPAWRLRDAAASYAHVVLDLGCGDGRHALRLARRRPDTLVLAVDANAGAMREASTAACRKPERGGVGNLVFLRAAAEDLPAALGALADEILVLYPWGSLLAAVVEPNVPVLRGLAGVARPGARLHVEVNRSAWTGQGDGAQARLGDGFRAAGWRLPAIAWRRLVPETTWGRRLGQGRAVDVLCLDAYR